MAYQGSTENADRSSSSVYSLNSDDEQAGGVPLGPYHDVAADIARDRAAVSFTSAQSDNRTILRSSLRILTHRIRSESSTNPAISSNSQETTDGNERLDANTAANSPSPESESSVYDGQISFFNSFNPSLVDPGETSKNLSVAAFLHMWKHKRGYQKSNHPPNSVDYLPPIDCRLDVIKLSRASKNLVITNSDLSLGDYSYQGLGWKTLGTTNGAVREARRKTYVHHVNIMDRPFALQYADINGPSRFHRHIKVDGGTWAGIFPDIPHQDNHLRFRQMNMKCKPGLTHFQLRHMLSASSKNAVFYAKRDQVLCLNPETETTECVMDFEGKRPGFESFALKGICTLTATHDLLIVGDLLGQYALKSLWTSNDHEFAKGIFKKFSVDRGINHVHTFLSRSGGLPTAVFCSNDKYVRILDCFTNQVIKTQNIGWAVNCSATSPDGRLRIMVGDQTEPWIVEAETGNQLVSLPKHQDYGFACDWSSDSLHVATGNQDGTVQIFDCRKWTQPVQVLPTELGGVRAMRFSPLGSGKRVLAMAEPADLVSIVDAETFRNKQRLEFLGEIGGLSFTPDGSKFFVSNTDVDFGGILEFDSAGDELQYDLARLDLYHHAERWMTNEHMHADEEMLHSSTKRKRRGRGLGEVLL